MKRFETRSAEETQKIAKEFAKTLKAGDVVALSGDLGAGKTAFTAGVAGALGVKEQVTSPTFTIVNQYDGDITLYHFDAYRLENVAPSECDWMDDYLFGDGISIIEWAENIEAVLPKGCINIRIEKDPKRGDDFREIIIDGEKQ